MKPTTLLTSLLTFAVLTPVLAFGATNCESKDAQMSTAQRTAFTKQCLADISSPANVAYLAQQQKQMSCEQNAKNKSLQGTAKANYLAKCVNQNDAKEAAVRIRSLTVISTR